MKEGKAGAGQWQKWGCTYDVLIGDNVDAELDLSKLPMTDCIADSIRVEHAPFWMGRVAGPGDLGRLKDGRSGGGMGDKGGGWGCLKCLELGQVGWRARDC